MEFVAVDKPKWLQDISHHHENGNHQHKINPPFPVCQKQGKRKGQVFTDLFLHSWPTLCLRKLMIVGLG
jgi:hypothetical protein